MAAAQAQLQGITQREGSDIPMVKWANAPLFSDVPTEDGKVRLQNGLAWLHSISRGGASLGANVLGTDPGAGGGGNAVVQQQHQDRNEASREAVLSLIKSGTQLHKVCSQPPFTNGRQIWNHLNTEVYLRIDDDVAQKNIIEVQSWNYQHLPANEQDENQVLHFKAKIDGYNPMMHPNMDITNAMKISIFCNGLHPQAKVEALRMKNNLAVAQ